MIKRSVKIELRGDRATDVSRLLYGAAILFERHQTLDDAFIGSGDFKVEVAIDTENAAFGSEEHDDPGEVLDQCVTEICRILREAAHRISIHGWVEHKLIDVNGNPVGQIARLE